MQTHKWIASPGDFDPRLVRSEGLKPLFQHLERVSDNKKATLKVGVALFDSLPRLILGAGCR